MGNCYIQNGDTILFQGDSITDCGQRDTKDHMGGGYVAMVAGMLAARYPDLRVKIINRGIGGDRTVELLNRWQEECIDIKPDLLSIKIGVNDVWRKLGEWAGQKYVPLEEYKVNLTALVDQAQAAGIKRIVLVSPTTIEHDNDGELNQELATYAEFARQLAAERGLLYADVRTLLMKARTERPEIVWTGDGCHPTTAGHALIAEAWMKAIENKE
jgi:acyl-CoA thioesterase-1